MTSSKSPKTPDAPAKAGLIAKLAPFREFAMHLARRIWQRPIQAGILIGLVLLPVLPIIVVQVTLRLKVPKTPTQPSLKDAWAALERHDFELAGAIARELGTDKPLTGEELKARPFILGVVADHDAEQMLGKRRRRLRLLATKYLNEARLLGFPEGQDALGLYLLGRDLYESGQAAESVSVLEEALRVAHDRAADLHGLLAAAYLERPQPNFHKALEHSAAHLADPQLTDDQRERALIDRSRIEFELGDYSACQKTLDGLPDGSAQAVQASIMRALLLEHEAGALAAGETLASHPAAVEKCRAAIKLLEALKRRDSAESAVLADAEYLQGRLRLEIGDSDAGLAQLRRTHQHWPDSDAGVAASFLTAEWCRQHERSADAMAAYHLALETIDAAVPFSNRWLSLDDVRTSVLDAYQEFLRQHQFEQAIELAKLSAAILGAPRSLQLQAQAHAQWGHYLLTAAQGPASSEQKASLAEGRRRLRQAGQLFRRLADLRAATREYSDDLYDAAEADLAGHDFSSAIATFQKYLKVESRKRRPRALLALGESRLALGKPAAALEALEECIEFHAQDAAVFEARLLASRAYLEQGRTEPAEKMLLENLYGDALSPASTEWRRSLFALGRLLYEAGRYGEAIERLDEAISRYPQDEEAELARYLAAESYRRRALDVQRQQALEATAEGRLARRREWAQLLETGLARFEQELNGMLMRQEQHPLSALEEAILRNCFFARGAILFRLGRYQEAIQAYASVTNRFQQKPEVLDAYTQIATCYRRLGLTAEAKSTVEQAKYALKHLPQEARFEQTSNYSRQEWTQLFETLGAL